MATEYALRSADFLNSIGVATHIDYTDSSYASIDKTLGALNYLGVSHVRDASPTPKSDPYGQGHLGDAAAAGVKFTFFAQGGEDPADVVARLHQFESDHPGAISAIEGPNEVNNWPVTYNGLSGTAGAQAYQKALYDAINADPLLKDIPVLGFTDYPFNSSASDMNNVHPYANAGDQPRDAILSNVNGQASVDPGKGFMITEMGYQTLQAPGYWEGIDPNTQAKLTLNAIMDAADLGSTRSYIYELLDEQPDPAGSDQGAHFGLFNFDGSPKPAATAVHNLTSILSDSGSSAGSFEPGSLDFSVTGMPQNGHTFLTAKSDGSYQIVAWNEPDVWDENADQAISPATTPVTVQLGKTFASVQVYNSLVGKEPVATYESVSAIDLSLNGHPLVIQVSNATGEPAIATSTDLKTDVVDPAVVAASVMDVNKSGDPAIVEVNTDSDAEVLADKSNANVDTSGEAGPEIAATAAAGNTEASLPEAGGEIAHQLNDEAPVLVAQGKLMETTAVADGSAPEQQDNAAAATHPTTTISEHGAKQEEQQNVAAEPVHLAAVSEPGGKQSEQTEQLNTTGAEAAKPDAYPPLEIPATEAHADLLPEQAVSGSITFAFKSENSEFANVLDLGGGTLTEYGSHAIFDFSENNGGHHAKLVTADAEVANQQVRYFTDFDGDGMVNGADTQVFEGAVADFTFDSLLKVASETRASAFVAKFDDGGGQMDRDFDDFAASISISYHAQNEPSAAQNGARDWTI